MFPFSFEWIWDMSHIVFMGGFWFALTAVGIGMVYCIVKTIIDTTRNSDNQTH